MNIKQSIKDSVSDWKNYAIGTTADVYALGDNSAFYRALAESVVSLGSVVAAAKGFPELAPLGAIGLVDLAFRTYVSKPVEDLPETSEKPYRRAGVIGWLREHYAKPATQAGQDSKETTPS